MRVINITGNSPMEYLTSMLSAKNQILAAGYDDRSAAGINLDDDVWDFQAEGLETLRVVWAEPPEGKLPDGLIGVVAAIHGFRYAPE